MNSRQWGQVIWVGPAGPPFSDAWDWMHSVATDVRQTNLARQAADWAAGGSIDAVVWAFHRRGQWRQGDVESVCRMAPFSAALAIHGSWSEGMHRSGPRLHGVHHLYWHNFVARAPWALAARRRTASLEEVVAQSAEVAAFPARSGTAWISGDAAAFSTLSDAVGLLHLTPRWLERRSDSDSDSDSAAPARLGIWDEDVNDARRSAAWRQLGAVCGAAPRIALVANPRWTEKEQFQAEGAAVVSKPFLLADLLDAIRRAAGAGDAA